MVGSLALKRSIQEICKNNSLIPAVYFLKSEVMSYENNNHIVWDQI